MSDKLSFYFPDDYVPDRRLSGLCDEALDLHGDGVEALCPAYSELAGAEDRYRDATSIGAGALKKVSRVYDRRTQRWVAMAWLREDRGVDFYDLFVREAWLIASLKHPNIIKVHDTGVDEQGRPFFTMDLKSNTTLHDLVTGDQKRTLNELLAVFLKVCDAIAYAHAQGIVHLDLKPENIQSDDFGEVLVCDWGLGKVCEEMSLDGGETTCPIRSMTNMTLLGQIKGSLGYMAPEQVLPDSVKEYRTDIYALGCILHFILTGAPPFIGSQQEILAATVASGVVSPRLNYPDRYVPESLDAVVMKASALDPADRYASVTNLQQEIENYLAGFATRAEQPGFFREVRLFVARNRLPVALAASSLLVFLAMIVLFAKHSERQKMAAEMARLRAEQLTVEVATLDSEVETLDFKHASYVEQTQVAKQALAKSLENAANELKNLAIYERPVVTVRQSRLMVEAALQQDPDCVPAHAQHFALDCLELNYQAALARPASVQFTKRYERYIPFIQAFPDFDFSHKKRPSLSSLVTFLWEARHLDNTQADHLERVLAYDHASRGDEDGYTPVVEAYLQYKYGGPDHLRLSFDAHTSTLSLWSDRNISLIGQSDYKKKLLRFLSFRHLELDISGQFLLDDLTDLPIESLDLSRCQAVTLKKAISLPHLRQIVIRPGQFSPNTLRRKIQTNERFEIIEIP